MSRGDSVLLHVPRSCRCESCCLQVLKSVSANARAQFGIADTGRPEENEGAEIGRRGSLSPRAARGMMCIRHGLHAFILGR